MYDVALLSFCYCLGMGSLFAGVTVVSLVVNERVSPGLALLPPALQKLVQTAASYPGARHKNRRGYSFGALLGALGYLISAMAVAFIEKETHPTQSFILLCVGYCVSGW